MVYDPSARSRSVSGVFPRGFPFTSTSASAGVDRINTLPVGALSTAADEGAGAMGALGAIGAGLAADLSAEALRAGGAEAEAPGDAGAAAGRSIIVESTPAGVSVVDRAARERRNHPTDSAAMIATATNVTAMGHILRPGSGSAWSKTSSSCDGCADHGRFRARGGG